MRPHRSIAIAARAGEQAEIELKLLAPQGTLERLREMPVIVQQLGPLRATRWMAANIPKYEKAVEELGPTRANLMFAIASLLNGCAYCVYAHGHAFQLHYFQQHGKLFPLDDHQLINLIPQPDDVVRAELVNALNEAGLSDEIELFNRLYALKLEGLDPTPEDAHLVHAIEMYDFLSFCAIESQSAFDDADARITKDQSLESRYAEARLAAGTKPQRVDRS